MTGTLARHLRLIVVMLAIAVAAAGFGFSQAHHQFSGYQSKSVIRLLPGFQVHSARKAIGSATFLRNVVNERHSTQDGFPGWIHLPGTANALKAQITTQPISGRVFSISATAGTPRQAVSLVRAVTTDFDLFMRNGAGEIRIITLATNAVPVSSSSVPSVEYGSIGLGVGLGLGLLLAAALGSFPGRREIQR